MTHARFAVAVDALAALYDADEALRRVGYRVGIDDMRWQLAQDRRSTWRVVERVIWC